MGSGKTHWGRLLAAHLHVPFMDLDTAIEQGECQSVGVLFAEKGEPVFREMERDYLHRLVKLSPGIIATGGGAPCFFDNLEFMKSTGRVIYLQTPAVVLARHLAGGRAARPLLASLEDDELIGFIENLLAQRAIFYEQAQVILPYADVTEAVFLARLVDVVT